MTTLWIDELDDRQRSEVSFAHEYGTTFHHGTDGHNRLILIDKMADMLNNLEREKDEMYAEVMRLRSAPPQPLGTHPALKKLLDLSEDRLERTGNGAYEGSSAHDMWQIFIGMIESAINGTLKVDYDEDDD